MLSDAVITQMIITGGGVLTTIVTVLGIVARSNHRQREKLEKHVDTAVEKGVENVRKELRQSRATKAVTDSMVGLPLIVADRAEVRP